MNKTQFEAHCLRLYGTGWKSNTVLLRYWHSLPDAPKEPKEQPLQPIEIRPNVDVHVHVKDKDEESKNAD